MRANANDRECGEQGTQRAARLAGTPRLVLLLMAGLRAAGRAPRLPTSVSADAVANAKRAQYAPAYRCGGSTGWVGRRSVRLLFPVSPRALPSAPSTAVSLATDSPTAAPHSGGSHAARG